LILMGTPEWAAISAERYALGRAARRPHCVPPEPTKYAQLLADLIQRYGDRIAAYEIWNEPDIQQFYRGTTDEYIALFKALAPVIRKLAPGKLIVSGGMAGYKEDFVQRLLDAGVFAESDLVGYHPYAGKSPAWDATYGQLQGKFYSVGFAKPIQCNESGFTWRPAQWFTGHFTPQVQRDLFDIAMGRLLATGVAQMLIFDIGVSDHEFDIFDKQGQPRPAYQPFADYLTLGLRGGRRLDVSLAPADGATPLQGFYVAAAQHDDGSVTAIVNPSESLLHRREVCLRLPLPKPGPWKAAARAADAAPPVELTVQPSSGQAWASLKLPVTARTVVELKP